MIGLATYALGLLLTAPPPDAADAFRRSELNQAVRAFYDLDDKKVQTLLHDVLARHPTPAEEARARVYLGLMEMNNLEIEAARRQFRQAIAADVAVELPRIASPKAKLLFIQVRNDLMRNHDSGGPAPPAADARQAPAQVPLVMTAPPLQPPPPAFSPSPFEGSATAAEKGAGHGNGATVAAYVMGGVALAALGTGIGFGAAQSSSKSGLPGGSNPVTDASQATTVGQTIARDGLIADVLFGVGGAAAVASLILFLVPSGGGSGSGSNDASPSASLSVGVGPTAVQVGGSW